MGFFRSPRPAERGHMSTRCRGAGVREPLSRGRGYWPVRAPHVVVSRSRPRAERRQRDGKRTGRFTTLCAEWTRSAWIRRALPCNHDEGREDEADRSASRQARTLRGNAGTRSEHDGHHEPDEPPLGIEDATPRDARSSRDPAELSRDAAPRNRSEADVERCRRQVVRPRSTRHEPHERGGDGRGESSHGAVSFPSRR